jgi:hypothetical protein
MLRAHKRVRGGRRYFFCIRYKAASVDIRLESAGIFITSFNNAPLDRNLPLFSPKLLLININDRALAARDTGLVRLTG